MRFLRMILWLVIIVVVLLIAGTALFYAYQDWVVFVPNSEVAMTPGELNLEHREFWIEVEPGKRIHGWYYSAAGKDARTTKTVLFCHGNAGNISHRVYSAQYLVSLGVNVLMFDYRGYGRSDGRPSEHNVYADAQAAWNWLIEENDIPADSIYLFGRSLGGAVVAELATRVDCAGVVIESSFTSAADMGKEMFPFLPRWTMRRFDFNTLEKMRRINCPVLITHSPDDRMIPYAMAERIYKAANEPKSFITLSGDHNDRGYFDSHMYINGLREFFGLRAEAGS